MAAPASLPDRARVAEHLANLRAAVDGERSPLGREWNHRMSEAERAFWGRAAGLGPTVSRVTASREWANVEPTARAAIRHALTRAAARAACLLQDGRTDA